MQVVPRLDSGGVEQGVLETGLALVAAGHTAMVVSAGGRMVADLGQVGIRHVTMNVAEKSPRSLRSIRMLRRLVLAERPDVLHPRSRLPAWLCWYALRGMAAHQRPGFATSVHGFHSVNRYSAIVTRGDRIEVVSDAVRAHLVKNYPVDPTRIRLIHRGIDRSRFFAAFRPHEQWLDRWRDDFPGDRPTIVLPGRLTRLKGHLLLCAVVERLAARGIEVRALIVGGAEKRRQSYARELRDKVSSSPILQRSVAFLGHRNDLREIMSVADVVVSLSTTPESFGRAVLEALSLGTPVVGFRHGGVGEILDAVYPAGAVGIGDVDGVADAIAHILGRTNADPIARHHPFTRESMQRQILDFYREVAA